MPQPVATWDGEDLVIWSFTVLQDPVVYGWRRERASALLLHWQHPQEPEDCPFFPELAPNWHKQKGPGLTFEAVEVQVCFFISCAARISPHLSHSHHCCCITLRHNSAPISPLSQGSFFQDCSIWRHCNLWAGYRMQDRTKWLLVDRESLHGVMLLPLDYLSHVCDAKKQENSPDMLLLPAPSKTTVPSSNLPMFPCWI